MSASLRSRAWCLALVCAAAATPLAAQVFRAGSDLVVLQAAVHDKHALPVADLT